MSLARRLAAPALVMLMLLVAACRTASPNAASRPHDSGTRDTLEALTRDTTRDATRDPVHVIEGVIRAQMAYAPVSAATVLLYSEHAGGTSSQVASDVTDAVGTYRLPSLLPGRYRVVVRHVSFVDGEATVTLGTCRDTPCRHHIRLDFALRTRKRI